MNLKKLKNIKTSEEIHNDVIKISHNPELVDLFLSSISMNPSAV